MDPQLLLLNPPPLLLKQLEGALATQPLEQVVVTSLAQAEEQLVEGVVRWVLAAIEPPFSSPLPSSPSSPSISSPWCLALLASLRQSHPWIQRLLWSGHWNQELLEYVLPQSEPHHLLTPGLPPQYLRRCFALHLELPQSSEQYHLIQIAKKEWEQSLDAIVDPVLVLGGDYRILRANLALARCAQTDIRQLIHTPCYLSLMGRDAPCPSCPLQQTLSRQECHDMELRHGHKDIEYHLHSYPIAASLPKQRAVHYYRDITEAKALQQHLIQADKLATVGLLAGRVAHELNNPITGILSQAQLLRLDLEETDQEHLSSLDDIEQSALRCRTIVQDLLNFSRQSPTHLREKHDPNQLVGQVLGLFKMIPPRNLPPITSHLSPDLPRVKVDPQKIQSVLLNLLTNAKDATPPTGEITISTEVEKEWILFRIGDTGEGIPPDLQEKIFLPFFSTKEKGKGTGLGLYIITEIIKDHQGRLEMESTPSQGTEFRVYLPAYTGK